MAQGLGVLCVPTSEETRVQAAGLAIPLTTLDDTPHLDLAIDGADELDKNLRLIKGGGGALLREKIVAAASGRMIVIADASKRVDTLGRFPLPVEVTPFGMRATRALIEKWCARWAAMATSFCARRVLATPLSATAAIIFSTACSAPSPTRRFWVRRWPPYRVSSSTGFFLGLADTAIVAGPDGVEVITLK